MTLETLFGKTKELKGRRKSSQKLAKRRTCVWGEGVSTVIAKQASKKKKKRAARRLRAGRKSIGPAWSSIKRRPLRRVWRTSPSNAL